MAGENLNRDQNFVTVIGGITNDSAQDVRMIRVDPITNRVLCSATAGGVGTVTTVSVLTANGFAGSVMAPTTTPAITISTTVTGLLKGNGTAISAAVSNADYQAPIVFTTSGTSGASTFDGTNLNIPNYAGGVTSVFTRSGAVTAQSGDYTTLLVTENTNLYFTNARAIASTLTGYASGAGTISATDSVLSAIQKLNGNAAALVTGVSSVNSLTGAVALTGTANRITISAANVFDISASYVGQSSIITLGTITTGVWNGTAIANANLANSTISGVALGGTLGALTATDTTLTFSGSYTGAAAQTVGINLARANTWTGALTMSSAQLSTTGAISAAAWGTAGVNINVAAATYTDTSSSGTVSDAHVNTFGIPTLSASSATTYTEASTVYIAGAPVAGSGVTIGQPLSLWVKAGQTILGGGIQTFTGGATTANFFAVGANAQGSTTTATLLFGGASTIAYRFGGNGGNLTTALATGVSYTNLIVGASGIKTFTSGTHAWLTNAVVRTLGVVTSGGAAVTNTATLYVDAASSAGTTNYTAYFNTGNVQVANGNLTLGTAGNALFITEGSNGRVGQVALVAGTKAITITGITTASRAFITLVTPNTTTLTVEVQAVCTANTLTIQANVAAGTINVNDISTYNYFVIN